ncbi:MAG: EAL domain-containing protein [Brevinematales bacterium]|jgi:diguanylate cyclase (GGDEF)-like protein/PAS domain S-box-containing protein
MPEKSWKSLDTAVLYVEDDAETRNGVEEFLNLKISRVYVASNGQEGIECYKKYHPEIIITDIKMPVMNGLEMIKKIKAINNEVAFIIVTAYNESQFLLDTIEIGVNHFLLKPINEKKLINSIESCMKVFTLEQELNNITKLLSEYKKAIDSSSIICKFDSKGIINYANDLFYHISGSKPEKVIGQPYLKTISRATHTAKIKTIISESSKNNIWSGEIQGKTVGGDFYYLNMTVIPIRNARYKIDEFMSIGNDITELIEKREELISQLFNDRLTGLPNRRKLLEDVEKTKNPILIIINIDSFQEINDFYGNEIGDFLIQEMGMRLKNVLPSEDYKLYKMPADEYAVLFDKDICRDEFEQMIQVLMKLFREEISEKDFIYHGIVAHITIAIGIAIGSEIDPTKNTGGKWHNLALNADMALKKAKRLQKNYIIFNESMQISKEYEYNISWAKKLKDSIRGNNIVPYFQPILNNHTNKIEKYECLVRMIDVDGKVHPPLLFLDMAKKSKLYHDITKIMISKSISRFHDKIYDFSINLSVDDILDEETNDFIMKKLKENYRTVSRLVFEILESEGIENYTQVKSFIDEIKQYQCKIAIDDFGTGYSNFSHILQLNVDYIKIDASLTRYIHQDKNSQIITQTIVDFTKKLGIKTIAEFVHSKEVFDKVCELGIDYSQGYYFGEPKSTLLN